MSLGTYSSAPGAYYCPTCPSNSIPVGGSAKTAGGGAKGGSAKKGSASDASVHEGSVKGDSIEGFSVKGDGVKGGNVKGKGKGGSIGSILSNGGAFEGATGCKCKKGYRSVVVKGQPLQCKSIKEEAAAAAAAARNANITSNGTNSGNGTGGGSGGGKKKTGGKDGSGKGLKKKSNKAKGSNRPVRNVTAADIHSRDPLTLEDEVD